MVVILYFNLSTIFDATSHFFRKTNSLPRCLITCQARFYLETSPLRPPIRAPDFIPLFPFQLHPCPKYTRCIGMAPAYYCDTSYRPSVTPFRPLSSLPRFPSLFLAFALIHPFFGREDFRPGHHLVPRFIDRGLSIPPRETDRVFSNFRGRVCIIFGSRWCCPLSPKGNLFISMSRMHFPPSFRIHGGAILTFRSRVY